MAAAVLCLALPAGGAAQAGVAGNQSDPAPISHAGPSGEGTLGAGPTGAGTLGAGRPVGGTPPGSFTARWSWPLAPTPAVLRHFRPPPERWNAGHRGVDLSATRSASVGGAVPILSPADGVVLFAGTVVDRPVLSIDHGNGLVSSFEPVTTALRTGDNVAAGDTVGTVEGPAHCPVACVHWGVRFNGDYVNPLAYVSDRRPSVLLPLRR
nr:M23 family metallopeptidase [Arthrobacter sp. Br18]